MKILSKIGSCVFYIIISLTLIAAIGSTVVKKPVLMTAIRSNSMYPLFQKGDMIFLNLFFSSNKSKIGDIIIFKTEGGSYDTKGWIVHRIIGGNSKDGYITQGDANDYTDQSIGGAPPIKSEWIVAQVTVIGSKVAKLPLIGQFPLLMENYPKGPYTLPIVSLVIFVIIGLSELLHKNKREKKVTHVNIDLQLIYFIGGLAISVFIFSTTLSSSQSFNISYEVSESNNTVVKGSNAGILHHGQTLEKPLSELNNKGFIPSIAIITCNDEQITLSHNKILLKQGMQINTTMTINALKPGKYTSTIHMGMFFPLLPQNIIFSIAKKNYWLAQVIVSLIPGLTLMLYPLFDSTLRRKTMTVIRHKLRRIKINFH